MTDRNLSKLWFERWPCVYNWRGYFASPLAPQPLFLYVIMAKSVSRPQLCVCRTHIFIYNDITADYFIDPSIWVSRRMGNFLITIITTAALCIKLCVLYKSRRMWARNTHKKQTVPVWKRKSFINYCSIKCAWPLFGAETIRENRPANN